MHAEAGPTRWGTGVVDSDEQAQAAEKAARAMTAAERRARGDVPSRPAKKAAAPTPAAQDPAPESPEAVPAHPAGIAPRRAPVKRVPKPESQQAPEPVKVARKRVAKALPTPPGTVEDATTPPEPVAAAPKAAAPRPAPRPAPVVQEPVPGVPITKTHVAGVAAVLLLLARRRRRRRRAR